MPAARPPETPQDPIASISTAVKADIHALVVAADLLRRGFAVFHKLGRATPCDLVIVQGRQCWRVATRTVRYATLPRSRGHVYPQQPPDPERFDVVADVLSGGVIRYEPPLKRLHHFKGSPVHGQGRRVGRSSGSPT
jgi:hypothetical protein